MKAVAIFAIFCAVAYSEAVVLTCSYGSSGGWGPLGSLYHCYPQYAPSILSRASAFIQSANSGNSQAVKGFWGYGQIHYFPRNLENIFPSLEAFWCPSCGLKELKREDLRPLAKLKYLYLSGNGIQILEKDLFMYNQYLQFVELSSNKISHIDPNVFDHLHQMSYLGLYSNPCVNKGASDNAAIRSLIAEIKTNGTCMNPQFTTITKTTTTPSTTTTVVPPPNNNLLTINDTDWQKAQADIKQTQNDIKDMKGRISALEAMTQKILEIVGNLTATYEEPNMSHRCGGEWEDEA